MLNYKFNFQKTLESAAILLECHHKRMEYVRLLKLLYIADRELLAERGRILTGDRAYAMRHGPVLSKVYDLIKNQGSSVEVEEWSRVIQRDGFEVTLVESVGVGRLTKAEESKLRELTRRYRDVDSDSLSDLTHGFTEWSEVFDRSNPNSAYPMSWETAMVAQGMAEFVEEAVRLMNEKEKADRAFEG